MTMKSNYHHKMVFRRLWGWQGQAVNSTKTINLATVSSEKLLHTARSDIDDL